MSQHSPAVDAGVSGCPPEPTPDGPLVRVARRGGPGFVALAAALTLASVPVARAWFEGRAALEATDRALRAGDGRAALRHAREAAGWWLPGSPFAEGAFARLRHIGHTAEAGGDVPSAVGAWRALLASAARVRWPTAQLEADEAHARAELARLEPHEPPRPPSPRPPSSSPSAALAGELGPGAALAAFATFGGLVVFAAGAALALGRAPGRGRARFAVAAAALGLALAALALGSK